MNTAQKNSNKSKESILIVDKEGNIANSLLEKIKLFSFAKIVYVSSQKPSSPLENLCYFSYIKKLPIIPKDQYSKIIIIYHDSEIFEFLHQFIKESEEAKGKLFFVLPFEYAHKNLKFEQNPKDFYTLIFGEPFGESFLHNEVNELLIEAKNKGVVKVADFGMKKIFPVFFDDAVSFLVNTVLKEKYNSTRFYLFAKHPFTNLSFVRLLQKNNPEIKVDFLKEEIKSRGEFTFPEGEYLFENKYVEEKIRKAVGEMPLIGKTDYMRFKEEIVNKKNYKNDKKIKNKNIFFFLTSIVLFLVIPIVSLLLLSFISIYQLNNAKSSIEKGDFVGAKTSAGKASILLSQASKINKILVFEASLVGQNDNAAKILNNIESAKEASILIVNLSTAWENFIKISAGKSANPRDDFIQTSNLLKQSLITFQKIKTEDKNIFLKKIANNKIDKTIQLLSSMSDVMPNLLGFEGEKKYLVLFQNNMELRPGGGFIGSYGIVSLENAKLKDFKMYDIYDADGQLKGHIEPPFAIRRYFPLVHWYFRDSNFDVDFTKNAANAVFFLNQEMGISVDGVIGVDITFVKNLLLAIGSVTVSDYNEVVNADNLYIVTQSHAEKNFFKGSTQKKDFLKSLYISMIDKLSSKNISYLQVAEAVVNSISQKHLLLVSGNTNLQKIFTVNSLSSSLWDNREKGQGMINDFFGISEANIGSDKANYFIKRKIEQEVLIDLSGVITEKVNIYYKNDGDKWPGGDYKNYLRFILPLGSKIKSVVIDGDEQQTTKAITDFKVYEAKNFQPPKELEVEESVEEGKSIFGFLVMIPQKSSKKISVIYTVPTNNFMDMPYFNYSLKVFKQPGTEDDPYSFFLKYPENIRPYSFSEGLSNSNNLISSSKSLSGDSFFEINFSRK
ncbi:MAG: DUF4012 domain-containing protein [bacterium]|nr:DUF4012 domain-containing protein [bacterium]